MEEGEFPSELPGMAFRTGSRFNRSKDTKREGDF